MTFLTTVKLFPTYPYPLQLNPSLAVGQLTLDGHTDHI